MRSEFKDLHCALNVDPALFDRYSFSVITGTVYMHFLTPSNCDVHLLLVINLFFSAYSVNFVGLFSA